jgi:hypothetical protein
MKATQLDGTGNRRDQKNYAVAGQSSRFWVLLPERNSSMLNWIDEAIKEEQRRDMLRAAARRLLVAEAYAVNRRQRPVYSPALARLGRRLELWGCRLQARYGVLAEAGIVRPAGEGARQC